VASKLVGKFIKDVVVVVMGHPIIQIGRVASHSSLTHSDGIIPLKNKLDIEMVIPAKNVEYLR